MEVRVVEAAVVLAPELGEGRFALVLLVESPDRAEAYGLGRRARLADVLNLEFAALDVEDLVAVVGEVESADCRARGELLDVLTW